MFNHLGFFLHCAATLEREAAEGYDQLSARMSARNNPDVAAMFAQFARFSRLHFEEIERLQVQALDNQWVPIEQPAWPDGLSPENPLAVADLDDINPRKAVLIALETERRACDFYATVAGQTRSARIQQLAQEFAEEESEHVAHLERWLERTPD